MVNHSTRVQLTDHELNYLSAAADNLEKKRTEFMGEILTEIVKNPLNYEGEVSELGTSTMAYAATSKDTKQEILRAVQQSDQSQGDWCRERIVNFMIKHLKYVPEGNLIRRDNLPEDACYCENSQFRFNSINDMVKLGFRHEFLQEIMAALASAFFTAEGDISPEYSRILLLQSTCHVSIEGIVEDAIATIMPSITETTFEMVDPSLIEEKCGITVEEYWGLGRKILLYLASASHYYLFLLSQAEQRVRIVGLTHPQKVGILVHGCLKYYAEHGHIERLKAVYKAA